jgi:WD40 repeat protein
MLRRTVLTLIIMLGFLIACSPRAAPQAIRATDPASPTIPHPPSATTPRSEQPIAALPDPTASIGPRANGMPTPVPADHAASTGDLPAMPLTADTLDELRLIHELQLSDPIEAVAFSSDGQTLLASSAAEIGLWNVSDGTLLHTLRGVRPHGILMHPRFESDERTIVVDQISFGIGDTSRVLGWDVPITDPQPAYDLSRAEFAARFSGARCADETPGIVRPINLALCISAGVNDPDHPALGYPPAHVVIQATPPLTLTFPARNHQPVQIDFLGFNHAGAMFALRTWTGATDREVQLYRTDGSLVDSVVGAGSNLRFSGDDRLLAYTHDDGAIAIWRVAVEGLEWVTALGPEPGAPVTMLLFTPDTQLLITGSASRVTFYQIATGQPIMSLPAGAARVVADQDDPRAPHERIAQGLALGPDGRILAMITDGHVQLWGGP